jgi:hypothetical protein
MRWALRQAIDLLWSLGVRWPALRRPCARLRLRLEHALWRGRPWR